MAVDAVIKSLLIHLRRIIKGLTAATMAQDQTRDPADVRFGHLDTTLVCRQRHGGTIHDNIGPHAIDTKIHANAGNHLEQVVVQLHRWQALPSRREALPLNLFSFGPLRSKRPGIMVKGNAATDHIG